MCDQSSYLESQSTPALPGSTADIPDIFDVLAGGEDEGTVRYLLGYQNTNGSLMSCVDDFSSMEEVAEDSGSLSMSTTSPYTPLPPQPSSTAATEGLPPPRSPVVVRPAQPSDTSSSSNKKRDTSGSKAIHNCESCGKSFTTKFNLKRHINMHCHKSKENGVPIQGPPSASAPAKKSSESPGVKQTTATAAITWGPSHTVTPVMPFPDMTNNNNNSAQFHNNTRSHDYNIQSPPQPDSTYRLPSVQTLLPISTVYTLGKSSSYTSSTPSFSSSSASFSSSSLFSSHPPLQHNTDYGALPADLFEPDSSQSGPPSPPTWGERAGGGDSLPSSPSSPLVMLTAVPPGWSRRVVVEQGVPRAKYFSPLGKRFNSYEEVATFFCRQNYSVPRHLFTFSVEEDEEEDEDEEDEEGSDDESELADSEQEESEAKRRRRGSRAWEGEEESGSLHTPWSPPASSSRLASLTTSPTIA